MKMPSSHNFQLMWLKTKRRLKSQRLKATSLWSSSLNMPPLAVENCLTHAKEGYYMACFSTVLLTTLWSKLGILKETVQVANLSGRAKTNPKIQVLVLRMSILHTFTTFVEPLPWPILVQIPMVVNSISTKIRMIFQVNSQLTASQLRSSMLIKWWKSNPRWW